MERHEGFFLQSISPNGNWIEQEFFRSSQTRTESAGFVGFSFIYIYTYIYIVPCLFEGVEGILRSMIEKLKA